MGSLPVAISETGARLPERAIPTRLDALLFHLHVDPLAGRVHVEPAGGCTAHADHCTLGRTSPGSRAVAPLVVAIRLAAHVQSAPARRPPVPALEARVAFLPPSRAPPAPLA